MNRQRTRPLFLAAVITVLAALQFTALADETPSYDSVFRLPKSAIVSATNNAGNYGGSVIANAVDGNNATHWETNKPNNATFHNVVTVTFDQSYELSSLRYLVRQDGASPKGFPLSYRILSSNSATGSNFSLLREGSFSSASSGLVSIDFAPTQVRRLQFEFVNARDNWASMAELQFYRYDALAKDMETLFTDKTNSKLSPVYGDAATLAALEQRAASHPYATQYLSLLADAKTLLTDETAFADRVFVGSQRGNLGSESNRTKTGAMYAFDPTGYYITPGETITVYVEADAKGVMPRLALGQIAKDKGGWTRFYNLKPGRNLITAPTQDKMNPAAIYISNEALPSQQAYAPSIRLVGGTQYPLYIHGVTSTEQFAAELQAYLKNVSYNDNDFANGNPKGYFYNLAEITSENNIISTSASGAYKEVQGLLAAGSSVEVKMDAWEDMYFEYARYSGFDLEDKSSMNYRPRGKFMSRVFCQGPYGWADYGYTGYNGGDTTKRDGEFFSSLIGAAAGGGWGVYHEWGHIYENKVFQRGESTNNLFSLHMQDIYIPGKNRMVTENRWEAHFTAYHNTKKYPNDQLFYGVIVYQLEAVYGEDLYGKAAKIARENPDGILNGLANQNDKLVVCLSLAAGYNFTDHFNYYKETVSPAAAAKIAHLPTPEEKTWYVSDKSFATDAAAFSDAVKPEITALSSNPTTLSIHIDQPKNAVLCHEIYRDGEFLAVTYSDTYVDKTAQENTTHAYTAISYDRKLTPSLTSDPLNKNASEPQITVTGSTFVLQNTSFDPLTLVTAVDSKGNALTVDVVQNTVDSELCGSYVVEYQTVDAFGNTASLETTVQVVEASVYLSSLSAKETVVGWGSFHKDFAPNGSPITLLSGSKAKPFAKGLGAHANSALSYDLSSGYQSFEAFLGIDQSMKGNPNSSAKFLVYVDDVLVYTSPVIRSNTEMIHLVIPVKGATTLRLVTNDTGNNNWGDQTVWADAKLVTWQESNKSELKSALTFAQQMTTPELYQDPVLNHKEDRWESLQLVLLEANTCLRNNAATQEEIDLYTRLVIYYIEENGQHYDASQAPVPFTVLPEITDAVQLPIPPVEGGNTTQTPATPETGVVPEVPTTPETGVVPEVPATPETGVVPEVPTTPETGVVPGVPATPETGVVPETTTASEAV